MTNAVLSYEEFCELDITSSRHGGNEESMAAFEKASLHIHDRHRTILRLYERHGSMSAKEVAQALGRTLNAISGRISELKAGLYLEPIGLRREGSAVLRRTSKEWQ